MFWCDFDQHLSYIYRNLLCGINKNLSLSVYSMGGKAAFYRWGFSILRQPHSSLFKMPSSVAEDKTGVTWEHTDEKWKFLASHKRKHIHFNNKRSVVFCHLSILRIIYTSRPLVFFFFLHQFWDDCDTQWLPAPNFPPTKTRVQDECSGVGA